MAKVAAQTFFKDYHTFREIMCNKNSSVEYVEKAYVSLIAVYLMATATFRHPDTTDEQVEVMKTAINALHLELGMRLPYMVLRV